MKASKQKATLKSRQVAFDRMVEANGDHTNGYSKSTYTRPGSNKKSH